MDTSEFCLCNHNPFSALAWFYRGNRAYCWLQHYTAKISISVSISNFHQQPYGVYYRYDVLEVMWDDHRHYSPISVVVWVRNRCLTLLHHKFVQQVCEGACKTYGNFRSRKPFQIQQGGSFGQITLMTKSEPEGWKVGRQIMLMGLFHGIYTAVHQEHCGYRHITLNYIITL